MTDDDRSRRQGLWLGLAGLVGSAGLAVLSGLVVEFAADWLTTHARAAWAIGVLVVAVVAVAVWQIYVRVIVPSGGGEQEPDDPGAPRPKPPAGPPVLPADISPFVGRSDQLSEIAELAGEKPVIAAVGRRGVGTSAFVLHAAHELCERYPDAQVYLDVRPGDQPLQPEQVLAWVCRTLRLPPPRSGRPDDLNAACEELRGWLARKRVLLVLHNVDDIEQVRRALPGAGHSLALLAGTPDLRNLEGAHCLTLEEPTVEEAVELLAAIATPELVKPDDPAARELVQLCGQHPLAVRLLGQQLLDHHWTVKRLRQDIEAAAGDPAYQDQVEGSDGLRRLWGTCDVAYKQLGDAQQRMFRLLGLVPATAIGAAEAAALAGLSPSPAHELLEELAKLGLVESAADGRYRLRELLMKSARLHLDRSESPRSQQRAQTRLARRLAETAAAHATALAPSTRRDDDVARAEAWFGEEQELLHGLITRWRPGGADDRQPPETLQLWLCRLAVPLCQWYAAEHRLHEWREVCLAILDTTIADNDAAVGSWAHNELGAVLRLQGEPAAARDELAAARELRPHRLRAERAQVETNLGLALLDRREVKTAITHFENARRLHGDRYGRALGDLGWGAAQLHDNEPGAAPLEERLAAARRSFERCIGIFDELSEQRGLAAARTNLGLVLWRQGDHHDAEEHWDSAEQIYTDLKDEAGLARVHLNQAAMLLAGDPERIDEAVDRLRESLQLRAGSADTVGGGLCHLHLGTAYAVQGDTEAARREWLRAEETFATLEADAERAEARERLRLLEEGQRPPSPRPSPPPRPDTPRGRPDWRGWLPPGWQRWLRRGDDDDGPRGDSDAR